MLLVLAVVCAILDPDPDTGWEVKEGSKYSGNGCGRESGPESSCAGADADSIH